MKKKKLNIIILLTLITPSIVNAADYIVCGNDKKFPLVIATMISTLFIIIRIIVPIVFVITGMISLLKATLASKVDEELNKAKKKLINNIFAALIIFFIVSIVNFVISLAAGSNNSFTNCINCMVNPDKCEKVDSNNKKLCPGLIGDQDGYNENCEYVGDPKERVDYGSGDTGVPDYTENGGSGGTHTLVDNPDATTNTKLIHKVYGENNYNYYLYVPQKIDSSKSLVVYLHGNGSEVGGTLADLKKDRGFAHLIEDEGKEFNSYILLPQTPSVGWNVKEVMKIINYEVELNGIDPKRISIWGFSMGANAVPYFVQANPNYFASAVILSIQWELKSATSSFATVPTYILYGAEDSSAGGSSPMYNTLKNNNYKAKLKIYPSPQSHGGLPGKALTDTELDNEYKTIMDWVLDQRRTD